MSAYTDNAYEILGVKSDASEKEIKTAYRRLALIHHPDRQADPSAKEEACAKFAAIANAYEVLSDEHLRAEYNSHRPTDSKSSARTPSARTPSSSSTQNDDGVFRYHFSDPYEVFKRDFRDQFGIEYPGAKYDWIDFDEPAIPTNQSAPPLITNGKDQSRGSKKGTTSPAKRTGFNPFRRKQISVGETKEENQLVLVPSPSGRELANPMSNRELANPISNNSSALVKVEKKNNRPVSMDVKTSKEGKVTTTTTTITRPDGSTETVTMKAGLPGKAKKPLPQLTNGERGDQKLLQSNGKEKTARLTDGKKKPMMLANEAHSSTTSKPKRKMLGWGGGIAKE